MSTFTRLSENALREFNGNKVKKHYLQAVGTALLNCGKSIAIQYVDGQILKVSAEKVDELKKAFSFFCAEYTPTMGGKNGMSETPPHFTVFRNMNVTVDGNSRRDAENTATVKDRQRMGKGNNLYRWNPTGALISRNPDTNCPPGKTWIVKSATGKILGTCRTLNGEAWGFVAGFDRDGNPKK